VKIEKRKKTVLFPVLTVVSVFTILVAVGLGDVHVPVTDVVKILCDRLPGFDTYIDETRINPSYSAIVLDFRFPRVILGFIVGGALAVAGAVMQGFFRNPMADPYIIGISSGAALGGTIAITFGLQITFLGFDAVPLMAFAGGLGITLLVYLISFKGGTIRPTVLLLTGIALGSLVSGITSAVMMIATQDLNRVLFWLMGGLWARDWSDLKMILPYLAIGYLVIFSATRELNAMLLGDEKAYHLGIHVNRARAVLLGMSALITSAAVSVSGIIGFVGLIVPHMIRLVVGPDYKLLLPASLLTGGCLLVLSDLLARTLFAPMEIPVGVVTAFLGCPFFLFLLLRKGTI
jgi:iron complex transport system permease protein